LKRLALLILCCLTTQANAAFVFSDVSYTSNSVSFTIDGDMSGYTAPSHSDQFSIVYGGDIFSGTGYRHNTWSTSVFDNKSFYKVGNTGSWSADYTWSSYLDGSIADAVATNRAVTVVFADHYLNEAATNPLISFVWGNGSQSDYTVLGSANLSPVPVPAAAWLFGTALLGLVGYRRKQAKKV